MEKHILIIELEFSGHRGEYVRWIAEGLLNKNYNIILALPKKFLDHPSLASLNVIGNKKITVVFLDNSNETLLDKSKAYKSSFFKPLNLINRDIGYFKVFTSIYQQVKQGHGIDFIIVPYLDYFLFALVFLGSPFSKTRWAGIIMRPDFHYQKMGIKAPKDNKSWLKELMFNRAMQVKFLEKLFTLDETMALYYGKQKNYLSRKLVLLPEPVDRFEMDSDTIQATLKSLNLEKKKYILVYGALTFRKGVRELFNTLAEIDSSNINVVLAGRAEEDVANLLKEPFVQKLLKDGCLKVVNRYITKDEEAALFLAAHALWVGYLGHYRVSGVLVQAVRNNIPVIACEEGVIGWQVDRHLVGTTVSLKDSKSIAKALDTLFNDHNKYLQYKKNCAKAFINNNFHYSTSEILKTI